MKLDLNRNLHYLAAVSFGPDSMALLSMLVKGGYKVSVAHVNYHQRKESDLEQYSLEQYCLAHDLDLYVLEVYKDQARGNFQSWAREARYSFFKKICRQIKADRLLVGHNLDDHLETYLMQKQRQKYALYWGIAGETVIKSMRIQRPLLDCRKKDLEKYCIENEVPYAIDQSNKKPVYTRNRIRLEVMSKLGDDEIAKLEHEAKDRNIRNRNIIEENRKRIRKRVYAINENAIPDEEELFFLLSELVGGKYPGFRINYSLLTQLYNVIASGKANWRHKIHGDAYLYKSYKNIALIKGSVSEEYLYRMDVPSALDTPYFGIDLLGTNKQGITADDYPLTIRNVRKDDYHKINGYRKNIFREFIDWKLPAYWRPTWPVILDKNMEILFVPRYRENYTIKKDDNFIVRCHLL